jgi:hypothetical protein
MDKRGIKKGQPDIFEASKYYKFFDTYEIIDFSRDEEKKQK